MQRDLVVRAQRGDREAFESLAEMSIAWLYNVAQLMLADSDLAQDAVQEALVVTWRDLRGLRDPDRFDAWLRRILVRCVYRVAKGERRQAERERLVRGEETSPDSAGELADRDEIDRIFRRIKAEYRAVIVLHHYLGFSDQEAGEALGVPAGTVKSRLHRATAAMRAELEADGRRDMRVMTRSAAMNERHDLDRELGTYLDGRATSQAPDGLLDAALGQIGATRQRPGWLVPERWFSAQATGRVARVMRGGARLALVALLIAIAVAMVVIVGSQRRLPPPFGLARPGLVVVHVVRPCIRGERGRKRAATTHIRAELGFSSDMVPGRNLDRLQVREQWPISALNGGIC